MKPGGRRCSKFCLISCAGKGAFVVTVWRAGDRFVTIEISVALGVENWIPASLLLPLCGSEGESDEAVGFAACSGAGTIRR